MKRFLFLSCCAVALLLAGCAQATPTPDAAATEQAMAQAVAATLTALAPTDTPIPTATPTPEDTATPTPSPTATATETPSATPTPTDTPTVPPTATPTPTATPLSKEDFIAIARSDITYKMVDKSDAYQYEPVCWLGKVFNIEEDAGMTVLQAWYFTGVYYSALEDGFNAFTAVYPGTLPDIFEDDEVRVCGWIGPKFEGVNVYGAVVRQPAIMAVYVDKHVRPTPRPTPTPVVYGMNEPVTIDGWVAKLYDVKKVKAVYFYDDAYIAKGYFLLVFVEFTNNTGGTAYPGELGWRLLDKKAGITRLPEFPAKATWYASWQYQSGRLYGDIQPGSVLGVVEAWDLPPDTGDLYLVADAAPGVAIYLGNFSQLPESR